MRSLIADLGDAYCESLRRTAIGPFEVDEAEKLLSLAMPWTRVEERCVKGFRRDEHQGHHACRTLSARPRHVAIGTFDGVHVGHRQVIDRADTVLTFEPHPLSVIHPDGDAPS